MTTELIPPTFICRALSDLVKRWDFLPLAFKYLSWNNIKTAFAAFNSYQSLSLLKWNTCWGKCHIREMSVWGNVLSGNCPFGELSVGELFVEEMTWGNCQLGKSPSEKCLSGSCLNIMGCKYTLPWLKSSNTASFSVPIYHWWITFYKE